MYDIIVGRDPEDAKRFGNLGTVLIGKQYVKMGQTSSLSNPVYLDVARSHVVFICGKRGSGKSYTMGVIAEAISDMPEEVSSNLAVVMLDTMGIYWTMKYPNEREAELLKEWGLKPKGLNVKIYTPKGFYNEFKEKGIPTDFAFSIRPSELTPLDWCRTLNIDPESEIGVLIARIVSRLKIEQENFSIQDIIDRIEEDQRADQKTKSSAENHFLECLSWGLFDKQGTKLSELVIPGQVSVLDVSCYVTTPGSQNIRALVIGLVAQKLFVERMIERRKEEFQELHRNLNFLTADESEKQEFPLVWLVIDEAHEFLPKDEKTVASDPLITILREGRQPGISLILASQQPGKIHTDVMTQADTVISHRLTAKIDIDALGLLMQSYMRGSLDKYINELPRVQGAAVVFDDANERMFPIRVRPRVSWHGGSSPIAIHKKKEVF
jgi:ABC-type dipeptide/oligopeptide/nickel transport system ATPase component